MTGLAALHGPRHTACFFIALLLSVHVHAARVKIPIDTANEGLQNVGSSLVQAESNIDDDTLAEVTSMMSEVQGNQNIVETEESDRSAILRVDFYPGSFISKMSPQAMHYTHCKYTLSIGSVVLLNIYDDYAKVGQASARTLQIFSDSAILVKQGKHGASVSIVGAEVGYQSPGQSRERFKFRAAEQPEALEQLIADLQSATILAAPAMLETPLATCTLQQDGNCWPQQLCERASDWEMTQASQAVCMPVRGDRAMAGAWRRMMMELTFQSETVLDSHCMKSCLGTWFYLTSHHQAAKAALQSIEAFDEANYPLLLTELRKGDAVVGIVDLNLAKAIDSLPAKHTKTSGCKLPDNLAHLMEGTQGDTELALKEYAKDCPELAGEIDQTLQKVATIANAKGSAGGVNASALLAMGLDTKEASGQALASSSSLMQATQGLGIDPVVAGFIICAVIYTVTIMAAVVVGLIAAFVSYLVLRLVVLAVCAGLSKLTGADSRKDFSEKCNRIGKKVAFGFSAMIGVGTGIIFGGPFAMALMTGGPAGMAGVMAPWAFGFSPVTSAYFLGAGATNPGALYGIAAAYGINAVSWGGLSVLNRRANARVAARKKAEKQKQIEIDRMKEWEDANQLPYPWKREFSEDKQKYSYTDVEQRILTFVEPEAVELGPLLSPWTKTWSSNSGRYYYRNGKTEEALWKRPVTEAQRMLQWKSANHLPYPWKKLFSNKENKFWYKNVETSKSIWKEPEALHLGDLPQPWQKVWSDEKDRYQYENTKTKEMTWTRPS